MGHKESDTTERPLHLHICKDNSVKWSRSVVSDSLRPRGLYSPRNSPGQDTGVGSHSLLQGIFPTQGSNPGLPHCRRILYWLSHQESPKIQVKNLPAMPETWVRFLSWEDPLEKGMATHSSILSWRIPWTEEPGMAGSELL